MSGRLLFKEKQLRLCVVAALASVATPVANSLVLPPNPLAVNYAWSCQSADSKICTSKKATTDVKYAAPAAHSLSLSEDALPDDADESQALVSLLEAPDKHFVLQWMAARERGELETLKDRYPVLEKATIAEYKRSGKTWYVLLDGPYSSRTEAMAELDVPPRSLMARELYPWTRSLASIQKLDIIKPDFAGQQVASTEPPALPAHMANVAPIEYNISYSPNHQAIDADQPQAIELNIPYGMEFSSEADFNLEHNRPKPSGQTNPGQLYASIAPTYENSRGQYAQPNPGIDIQDFNVQKSRTASDQPREQNASVLTANPERYTIEWMSAGRKASLERAQLRYPELRDTQIIQYQSNNQNRYALVGRSFTDRTEALDALLMPSLAKISARLSPKVRQVAYLQSLASVASQPSATPEPTINDRQWLARDKAAEKTYLTDLSRQVEQYRQKSALAGQNHYTIQWFSSTSPQAIDKLKQRFPELAAANTVHIRRNQKDWYVLVQGQYRTSQEAIKALQSPDLKHIAMILHPWTRPLNSLKRLQIASL